MFTIRRADNENCLHCSVSTETLNHKFSECSRVRPAWNLLQQKIRTVLHGWRSLRFEDIMRPALENLRRTEKLEILKLLVKCITFTIESDNVIDINALNYTLKM